MHPPYEKGIGKTIVCSTYFGKNLEKAEFVAWMQKMFSAIAYLKPNDIFCQFESLSPPQSRKLGI
jgi:hypothetical protein